MAGREEVAKSFVESRLSVCARGFTDVVKEGSLIRGA